jgi:hypothetical protein
VVTDQGCPCLRSQWHCVQKQARRIGPAKNRLHDYEAGWLTLLIEMVVATRAEAEATMSRVAQADIDEKEAERQRRRSDKHRKKRPEYTGRH